jgi:hypothetical protein
MVTCKVFIGRKQKIRITPEAAREMVTYQLIKPTKTLGSFSLKADKWDDFWRYLRKR